MKRYYLGVDWSDKVHEVCAVEEAGKKVTEMKVEESPEGMSEFGRWLDEQRGQGTELWAAIEKPEGRIVDFLLDHGVMVYPINPKALDRARDRFLPCYDFAPVTRLTLGRLSRARLRPRSLKFSLGITSGSCGRKLICSISSELLSRSTIPDLWKFLQISIVRSLWPFLRSIRPLKGLAVGSGSASLGSIGSVRCVL